jgi:hypothetical protein
VLGTGGDRSGASASIVAGLANISIGRDCLTTAVQSITASTVAMPTSHHTIAVIVADLSQGRSRPVKFALGIASEHGAGIEDLQWVKGILDPMAERHHVRTELVGQLCLLQPSHAVLTRDRPAE